MNANRRCAAALFAVSATAVSGYVTGPAAGLRSSGTLRSVDSTGVCAVRMQEGGLSVSRKGAVQLMSLALAALPKQAAALLSEGEEIIETEWGPYTKKAADAGKKKGANNLKCKAAIGGGQTCEGSKEVEFTKAFDTKDGARTKVTGDANKVSTYFSQIDAGYKTLVELADRWDEYMDAGDGDVVRRRLGTVGSKSPLHNVRKAFEGALTAIGRLPIDKVDEETLDWLDENSTAILNLIAEVDSNLYSTAFVGTEETSDVLRAQGKTALDKALTKYEKFDKIIAGLSTV